MEMKIAFPGGQKVNACFMDYKVETDQPKSSGGSESAPDPFSLFLSSIGTCTGIYVLRFCQERNISTKNLNLILQTEWNEEKKLIETIKITVDTGPDFPVKYKPTLKKVAGLCTVKRHLENPPSIDITIN